MEFPWKSIILCDIVDYENVSVSEDRGFSAAQLMLR